MGFIKGRRGLGLRQLYHEGQCRQDAKKRKNQQFGDVALEQDEAGSTASEEESAKAMSTARTTTTAMFSDGAWNGPLSAAATMGRPVLIHIYDVTKEGHIRKVNNVLASRYSPLKFGGMFHVGVEVNGIEWCYGGGDSGASGVDRVKPKMHPHHNYRQTLRLRYTKLSSEDFADLVAQLEKEYITDDYDILNKNCCHFAEDFCKRLGVGTLPGWIYRLARLGAQIDGVLEPLGL
jgi:hypothetical protein